MKKKYNVTLQIIILDTIYDIEAKDEQEAENIARDKTNYRDGHCDVYEVEEVEETIKLEE